MSDINSVQAPNADVQTGSSGLAIAQTGSNTLKKTYVPSFEEFVENPDKWLSELEGYNTNQEDVNGEAQSAAQPVIGSTEESAPAQATASGDVGLGGPDAGGSGASAGWDTAGAAQPMGGQMTDDQGGLGDTNIQAPDAGAQPGAAGTQMPGAELGAPQPGSEGAAPAQPGTQPAAEGGFNTPPPTPQAQEPAAQEDPNNPNQPKQPGF